MRNIAKLALAFVCVTGFGLGGCNSTKTSTTTTETEQGPAPQPPPLPTPVKKTEISFQDVHLIREFAGTDKALLFAVLSPSGPFKINSVRGPEFIKTYRVGELNQGTLAKLFVNSSQPLSAAEKQDLLQRFNGATLLYAEGYAGNLCTFNEQWYQIIAAGKVDDVDVEVTFKFEALPGANGNCEFHQFMLITKQ